MQKPITAADPTAIRVVIVTLDKHLCGPITRARSHLKRELPGLTLTTHCATDFTENEAALARCREDIAKADIVVATMLFMEDHIQAVLEPLRARAKSCDAFVGCLAAPEITRLTRMGRLDMSQPQSGPMAFLKKLRGKPGADGGKGAGAGAQQLKMLRRIPRILRFVPGAAQDLRAYLLTLQYWLAGSDENIANLVRYLIDRYADGERRALRGSLRVAAPVEVADVGLYHPALPGRVADKLGALPARGGKQGPAKGRVGLLLMRSYVLAGDTAHYDAVIAALEARGLDVVPAFAAGLDARPAIERFFLGETGAKIDLVVSLTGFSLVGGPAYNDSRAAEEILARLDVPYVAAQASEFQTLTQWRESERGLTPVETTMMVALPELDGATGPILYAGRDGAVGDAPEAGSDMRPEIERVEMLAARVARLVALRRTPRKDRRIAVTLFNFPPNGGATGTAAFLSVFASLRNTLARLKAEGYEVEVPASVDALREALLCGNAARYGADANVAARISADDHVRRETHLAEIEAQWGPAPGRLQSDGSSILVLGARFGNVFVGVQPGFGYEGDPMRLLFEKGFAPTHAFSAYYRYLREDFAAHAVLHFGTHGALEFMPGKHAGLGATCWPDRLIGDLPNIYLYAANNPSEGTIAKRRAAATLVSYLTPPVTSAGLYRGLVDLKASLDRWRGLGPEAGKERGELAAMIRAQAEALDLVPAARAALGDEDAVSRIWEDVLELETALIPHGLHVVGGLPTETEKADLVAAVADARGQTALPRAAIESLVRGDHPEHAHALGRPGAPRPDAETLELFRELGEMARQLGRDHELPALVHALDGGYVRPVPGGDLLRSPAIVPTGRNIHGFDPFRIPSAYAVVDGARQAEELLLRHRADGHPCPETIAMVLWGTDTLKTEGAPVAQALALVGARPRFDSYGRLCGTALNPLEALGRPRIDVVATLSGIFRDLMPLQTRMLAEAAFLAASADEPIELNFVRKHALDYQAKFGCDLETAALRIFSNADGTYGANVNFLIDSGAWDDEDELGETFSRRKCFAYGMSGAPVRQARLFETILSDAELAYQNLESVELGVTTVDQYFDSLGGMSRAIGKARRAARPGAEAAAVPVYIGDQTRGRNVVRSLGEQVSLEARTRMLNPKWYEGMLSHGYEGVRHIEAHVTNTMGWSATTGQVDPWVYQGLTETFVLDPAMRQRLAALNPKAAMKVANRLFEAHQRNYWSPDAATLEALRSASEALEDQLEGINEGIAS